MNQIDLKNKKAVITGGAQGIGLAIAELFLESGASVSLWDQDEKLVNETASRLSSKGNVDAVVADVSDLDLVKNAVIETQKFMDGIDILVCNAGISGPNEKLWDYPPKDWQKIMNININGVFNCLNMVTPIMIEQNYGRIVNVSSVAGKEGNPGASAYSASKAAVIAMTKSLGKELADFNIAVNCITPAAAKTQIFDQMKEEHIQYMLGKIPRGRFLKVEEAASMVAWLSSNENSFTTGGVFDLSGGRSTY
jgi:2-dehydro-3-deoxy-L-rhamnonate dehydrogenase (NAD+)